MVGSIYCLAVNSIQESVALLLIFLNYSATYNKSFDHIGTISWLNEEVYNKKYFSNFY